MLTAFVREKSQRDYLAYQIKHPSLEDERSLEDIIEEIELQQEGEVSQEVEFKLATDIQTALTVIGRRKWREQEEPHPRLDLRNVYLPKADLTEAHLEGADLTEAHLVKAGLRGTHLKRAFLFIVNLEEADLRGAHLEGATLVDAELAGADFRGAHLEGATLDMLFDLTLEDLSSAIINEQTKLPYNLEQHRPQLLESSRSYWESTPEVPDAT